MAQKNKGIPCLDHPLYKLLLGTQQWTTETGNQFSNAKNKRRGVGVPALYILYTQLSIHKNQPGPAQDSLNRELDNFIAKNTVFPMDKTVLSRVKLLLPLMPSEPNDLIAVAISLANDVPLVTLEPTRFRWATRRDKRTKQPVTPIVIEDWNLPPPP